MFEGPIFIVGRPRSGTKLLRDLLNRHSEISIPFWESAFIPDYREKVLALGRLDNQKNLETLIDWLGNTEFYREITGDQGYPQLTKELWLSSVRQPSYAGVVAALFQLYAGFDGKRIWGDKYPHYMLHMPLLKELFPDAKFIHIIRDVRDNCLSNMKTWGKRPLRSAQLWVESIAQCRRDASRLGQDYCEVKYESLLQAPEVEIRKLCSFLGVDFEPTMTSLARPAENLGDTRNAAQIVRSNMEKWRNEFSPDVVKQIEEISFQLLQDLGYPLLYANRQTRLTPGRLLLFKVVDAWKRFRFDCSDQGGIGKAVWYQYRKRRFG